MKRNFTKSFIASLACIAMIFMTQELSAQCSNANQYPAGSITPDPAGALTSISTCNYLVEFSIVTGVVMGEDYQFTVSSNSAGGYITVEQDAAVLGNGVSPLLITAGSATDITVHWNADVNCATTTGTCEATTVQCISCLTCAPPVATFTLIEDCDNGYTVDINVTDLGNAASVDIFDGTSVLATVGLGPITVGPFTNGTPTTLTLLHDSDPVCDLLGGTFVNTTPCIFTTNVDCAGAAATGNFCYGNTNLDAFEFVSSDGSQLQLTFPSGNVENNFDELIVYDSDGVTELYNGYGATGDITGLTFNSTGDKIYFTVSSDGSVSCVNASTCCASGINYSVSCLSCTSPIATFTVVEDCVNGFSVLIDVTDMGNALSLDVFDGTSVLTTINGAVPTTVGPFTNDTPVDLTLVHDSDVLCDVSEMGLVNPNLCPTMVDCVTGTSGSFCYDNFNTDVLEFISMDGSALQITFDAGVVENTYDPLIVYDTDGVTELYNGFGNAGDITGLTFGASGDRIFFTVAADNIFSCATGEACCVAGINYTVSCYTPCGAPSNIQHSLDTPARCSISWDMNPNALRYDVVYKPLSDPTWIRSGALNNYKTLHYLLPNTVYVYRVRSYCGDGWDFANASEFRYFNTANIPDTSVPSREGSVDFATEIMDLYPNPASEIINVEYFTANRSDVNLYITDMMGRTVLEKTVSDVEGFQRESLDISELGQGYYMVVMVSGDQKSVKKFVKMK